MNGACRSFIWGMLGACMAVFAQTGASGPQGSAPSADSVPAAPVVKPSLAVLPTVYPERFKPVMRLSERFSAGGAEGLRTIFTTEHEVRREVPNFTSALSEAFAGVRRFDVLERDRFQEVLQEVEFADSVYADCSRVVPMGKAMAAEFVALPEIDLVDLQVERRKVPYTGSETAVLRARIAVKLRVVETSVARIVAATTKDLEREVKLKPGEAEDQAGFERLLLDLYRDAAKQLALATVGRLHPVRIVEIRADGVVLNLGEGAVDAGDAFDVFALGRRYTDPDSGEMLGRDEARVGQVKVVRVLPKFSEAVLISGADAVAGDPARFVCRRAAEPPAPSGPKPKAPLAW